MRCSHEKLAFVMWNPVGVHGVLRVFSWGAPLSRRPQALVLDPVGVEIPLVLKPAAHRRGSDNGPMLAVLFPLCSNPWDRINDGERSAFE